VAESGDGAPAGSTGREEERRSLEWEGGGAGGRGRRLKPPPLPADEEVEGLFIGGDDRRRFEGFLAMVELFLDSNCSLNSLSGGFDSDLKLFCQYG